MLVTLICTLGFGQVTIKKIKDPHIRAQQDRMVITGWGDFLPKPRYFLGINMNYHYTMTWSWGAPAQNRRYKNGADIRPLGPTGQQTQRMAMNTLLKSTSDRYRQHSDSIARTTISELYHHSGLVSGADPLWQLYYRKELENVLNYNLDAIIREMPIQERSYLTETGIVGWFDGEMLRLHERLEGAFSSDMDRGSRILSYHRLMKEYRNVAAIWDSHVNSASSMLALRKLNEHSKGIANTDAIVWNSQSDSELMDRIITEAKKLY